MHAPSLKVSTAADIGPIEKLTELIELPHPQGAARLVFRIRALNGAAFAEIQSERNDYERSLAIARLGIVEPEMSFGEERESGKAWWGDLILGNQGALIQGISRLSGVGQSPDAEAATRAAKFPAQRKGRANGATSDPALPAAAGAA